MDKVAIVATAIWALGFIYGLITEMYILKFMIRRGKTPKWLLKLGYIRTEEKTDEKSNTPA